MQDPRRLREEEDDGRVIADMSSIERTPLLAPRIGSFHDSGKEKREERKEESRQDTVMDREERGAFIRGAVSAGLVVGGTIAAAFARLIILINVLWG